MPVVRRVICRVVHRSLGPLLAVLAVLLAVPARAAPPEDGASQDPPPELEQPRLLNEATILYPEALLDERPRPQGTVVLKYVVGTDGVPKEIEVLERVHPVLDERAREAVEQLRYEPGKYKGEPVEIVLRTAIEIAAPEVVEPEPPPEGEETRGGGARRATRGRPGADPRSDPGGG